MQKQNIIVRLTKRYAQFNKGERAGFSPNLAARLVRAEGAVIVSAPDGWDPDKELEITRERPRGADEETKLRRVDLRIAFGSCPQSGRDKNGKPSIDAMAHITGNAVLQDDLDHAWELHKEALEAASKSRAAAAAAAEAKHSKQRGAA